MDERIFNDVGDYALDNIVREMNAQVRYNILQKLIFMAWYISINCDFQDNIPEHTFPEHIYQIHVAVNVLMLLL